MSYNPEFIKRLAMGDETAFQEVKGLSLIERMAIGNAVDQLKRDENIVPVDGGKMSIYEEKQSKYSSDEEIGKAIAERLRLEKENKEKQEKASREHMEKVIKYQVERSRARLTY